MRSIVGALLALALFPAAALAAPPAVTTGGVADVTESTATLLGSVDPNGNATSVVFRFGPTTDYGAQTTPVDVGNGSDRRALTAPITGLTPFTRIHYRLVATYADGKVVRGKDRTFRTKRQPLGLTLAASPATISFGGMSTLSGTLAGTGNAGRQVRLLSNPYPYTQGFQQVGNPQVVGETGAFSFPALGVTQNTQYQVQVPGKPEVVSPVVFVGVRVKVGTTVKRGKRLTTFSGRIAPATDGALVAVQKRIRGEWRTKRVTIARPGSDGTSKYRKKVKVSKRGLYRVAVTKVDGAYVDGVGRAVRVRAN